MVTTAVLDESSTAAVGGRSSARFTYSKVEGRCLKYVIADVGENGEEWSEQESGESQWYPFTPSAEERELVRRWMEAGARTTAWPHVVLTSSTTMARSVP